MSSLIAKIEKYFSYDIWHVSNHKLKKKKGIVIFYLRVISLSIRGYVEDRIGIRASALTFFTLLSVVPVLAMGIAIAQGFGIKEILIEQLKMSLEGHEEVFDYVVAFADSMLKNTKGGCIGGIGTVVLLWSVIKVLWNIENSFNFIWQVKKQRSYIRKLSDYLSIIIVAPILVVLAGSISIFISTQISKLSTEVTIMESFSPFIVILLKVSPFVIIWILLTLLYMVMPNTVVKFKSAFIASVIAGSTFQLVQWGYIHFQVGVSQYNAIYGSFAAFPLFLVFLQISWLIVLFGAEISYAYQNVSDYEFEKDIKSLSFYNRRLACISVLYVIVKSLEKGEKPRTIPDIVERFGAPFKLVSYVLETLVACELIAETEMEHGVVYLPTSDIYKLDLYFVITKLNDLGTSNIPFDENHLVSGINKKLQNIRKELKLSKHNVLIKDL